MGVTIVDIAKHAKVSVGTVSGVLNDRPSVSPARRELVLKAMGELNYQPNPAARRIRRNKQGNRVGQMGLLFVNFDEGQLHRSHMAAYIHGIQHAMAERGQRCTLSVWREQPGRIPPMLLDGEVDGVFVKGHITVSDPTLLGRLKQFPLVWINQRPMDGYGDAVVADYSDGVAQTIEHLVGLGHQRIAMVMFDDTFRIEEKITGYRQGMRHAGLEVDEHLLICREPRPREVSHTPPDCTEIVQQLLSMASPPTAIISSDWPAVGLCRALTKHGVSIPDQVSVVGYDSIESICESLDPALTSYELAAHQIGQTVVRQMDQRLAHPDARPQTVKIRGNLVIRGSTAPPPNPVAQVRLSQ